MSLEKSPLRVNPDRLVKGIMLKAERTVYLTQPHVLTLQLPLLLALFSSLHLFLTFSILPCDFPHTCFTQSPIMLCTPFPTDLLCALQHTYKPNHTDIQADTHMHSSLEHRPFFNRHHLGFRVSICRGLASCVASHNPRSLQRRTLSGGKSWWAPTGLKEALAWERRPCLFGT